MRGTEIIEVNGIEFKIGYLVDREFNGYVFEIKKNNKWYGALFVNSDKRELGFRSGVFATDEEVEAIEIARKAMKEKYGANRFHG